MANQHPILAKSFIIRIGIGVSAGTDPVANHIQLPQTLSPKIPATRDRSPCILTVLGSWSIAASPTSAYLTRPTLSRVLQSIDSAVALPSVGPLGPLALCASLLFPLRDLPEWVCLIPSPLERSALPNQTPGRRGPRPLNLVPGADAKWKLFHFQEMICILAI